jgi:hypothetical protein
MFQKVLAAAAILIAASALFTHKPADTEAAPAIAEIVPLTEAEFSELQEQLRKQIELNKQLTAELEAAKSAPTNNPPPDNGPALQAMLVSADCANGQCNVRRVAAPVRAVRSAQPVRRVASIRPLRRLFGR